MLKNERYFHIQTKINTKILRIKDDPNRKIPEHEIIKISLIAKYMKTIKAISLLDLNGFFEDAKEAYRYLISVKREEDIVYIAGSLYLIGQIKTLVRRTPDDRFWRGIKERISIYNFK